MNTITYKIVVGVPESHTRKVLDVLGSAGAGKIGNYSHCSSVTKTVGHFKPLSGAHPTIGEIGKIESVIEDRIETWCYKKDLKKIIQAIKSVHPYEEPVINVYKLEKLPAT
ncbi:hypothetical protein A2334_01840 [Candidatus Roizmanbacteria bacterium RIFOXYB2_FULL_38_10]|uniref:NGG1p interacting factor NIF3 n=1 Tax=Candidatus Roizmanbacteria bacterium RIFOXYD1_FULL_38_12 TaxID=1802093 RepID=A0A1F7L258_9BACT|nr:MAG: hypothetical protein A3K47_05255 [Candidatus Roizmanbacteria bacterium RIFOXYA2_FULL_38_14]OGK64153.1 MAG: hypothetical protein A3K27_05255 [Candidatus Roizmanbacteria bacterium RIFOXYA1_FULL_37_12]OGK65999.1 MAG: hypothetical protein A3K38_05255 [Candidatus Roizmanbacteria bacterium RIFOXYB1_FULL_40_23]OGK67756.1 MAG: hypothetical protein A2334_01840 [Candidatus Roizmanbacteria bacterium RIFOXYB2_FULL_38_10]OGK70404.1 MAG: hypothetical protein A3K21_05260 [Candidatus Roizmanbacteria ba